jgi:hypothetical protein
MVDEQTVSDFIQRELARRNRADVPAVEAAQWLDDAGLLPDLASRPAKPLRDLLRAGKIVGQRQEMDRRWFIDRTTVAVPGGTPAAERTVTASDGDETGFAAARRRYRPPRIRYVLVAESPPQAASGRFFYYEDVTEGDSLFWETMKVLYPDDYRASDPPRHRKREFMGRFRDDGFYLIDAVDEPLGDAPSAEKRRRIGESLPRLCRDLGDVCAGGAKAVLISAPVYDACAAALRAEGVDVINEEMIDFPGSGGQRKFCEKLTRLLLQHGALTI